MLGHEVFSDGVNGLHQELFFILVMQVKRRSAEIRLVGDVFNRDRVIPFFQDETD